MIPLNRVYKMDAFALMEKISSGGVDLVLTSPPYLDKEVVGGYYSFLDHFVDEAMRVAPVVLMFNSSRRMVEICRRYGNHVAHVLIWDKMFTLPAFKYEPIFVLTHEKIFGPGRIYRDHLRYKIPRKKVHINQNPVELYAELLRFFPKAKVVLDPFCGSGTTALACLMQDQDFILGDMAADCVRIANERIQLWKEEKENA